MERFAALIFDGKLTADCFCTKLNSSYFYIPSCSQSKIYWYCRNYFYLSLLSNSLEFNFSPSGLLCWQGISKFHNFFTFLFSRTFQFQFSFSFLSSRQETRISDKHLYYEYRIIPMSSEKLCPSRDHSLSTFAKKCYFFERFCERTKWTIPSGETITVGWSTKDSLFLWELQQT